MNMAASDHVVIPPVVNAMTVDVEDYFQVSAFEPHVDKGSWESLPRRVEPSVDRILQLFDERSVKGTFFTLGWVAERHPQMVRRIVDMGHELASHGYWHQLVYDLNPAEFAKDIADFFNAKYFRLDKLSEVTLGNVITMEKNLLVDALQGKTAP